MTARSRPATRIWWTAIGVTAFWLTLIVGYFAVGMIWQSFPTLLTWALWSGFWVVIGVGAVGMLYSVWQAFLAFFE